MEKIVNEVNAPKGVPCNIDHFVTEISGIIERCELTNVSTSKLNNFPIAMSEHLKFPGAKILHCSPVNALKTKNLGDSNFI